MFVEGGAELAGSLLTGEHVDQLRIFIAPILLGSGRPLAIGPQAESVADAVGPLAVEWAAQRRGHARERAAAGVVMFTGIVKELGSVAAIDRGDDGARIAIGASFAGELAGGRLGLRFGRLPHRDASAAPMASRPT